MPSTQTLTKADIALSLSHKMGFSKVQCAALVDQMFELMKNALEKSEEVKISGLGCFEVRKKRERRGRNPQTGESIQISARKVIVFRSSPLLRQLMEETPSHAGN